MTAPADRAAAQFAVVLALLPVAYARLQASPSPTAEAVILAGLLMGMACIAAQAIAQGVPPWPCTVSSSAPGAGSAAGVTGAVWMAAVLWVALAALAAPGRPALAGVAAARLLIVLWTFCVMTHAGPRGRARLELGLAVGALEVILMALAQAMGVDPTDPTWLDRSRYALITRRISACMVNPNLLGAYLAALIPWLLAGVLERPGPFRLPLAASAVAVLILTFSRGAWLGAGAGVLTMAAVAAGEGRWPADRARLVRAVLAVTLVCAPLAPLAAERIGATRDPQELGRAQRVSLLAGVAAYARRYAALGSGPGSFAMIYPMFRTVGGYYPRDAHGDLFQFACELGLPAAAVHLWLLVWLLMCAARSRPARLGSAGVAAAALGTSVFVTSNQYLALQVPLWTLLALAWPGAATRETANSGTIAGAPARSRSRLDEPQDRSLATAPDVTGRDAPQGRGGDGACDTDASPVLPLRRRIISALLACLGFVWLVTGAVDGVLVGAAGRAGLALAVRLESRRDDVLYLWAQDALRRGDAGIAREALEAAQEVNPLEARYPLELARLAIQSHDMPRAWTAIDRARALDPRSEEILLLVGKMQILGGNLQGALATLSEAAGSNEQYISLNPEAYRPLLALLAAVQDRLGHRADAERTRARARAEEVGERPR